MDSPALPPLVATIVECLLAKGFDAEDRDYAPEDAEEEPCFQTSYADSNTLYWHLGENQLHWSFYSFYFKVDDSDDPYTDVALIEMGVGTDFTSNAATVTLELTENPHGASGTTTPIQMQLSNDQDWNHFITAHITPAVDRGEALIDGLIDNWSDDDTDGSEAGSG